MPLSHLQDLLPARDLLIPLITGLVAAILTLLLARRLAARRRRHPPHQLAEVLRLLDATAAPTASGPAAAAPQETRSSRVLVVDRAGDGATVEAEVLSRSATSVRLAIRRPFAGGSILSVGTPRPGKPTIWASVEVAGCRPGVGGYELDCHFLTTPPSEMLRILG